jgi:hypothetical protein
VEIWHTIFVLTEFPHAYVITFICTNLYHRREVDCTSMLKSYYEFNIKRKISSLGSYISVTPPHTNIPPTTVFNLNVYLSKGGCFYISADFYLHKHRNVRRFRNNMPILARGEVLTVPWRLPVFLHFTFERFSTYVGLYMGTADGGTVVKVLRYKSEGRCFDSSWCHWNFLFT